MYEKFCSKKKDINNFVRFQEVSLSGELYGPEDRIVLLNNTNFKVDTVCPRSIDPFYIEDTT